MNSYEIPLTKGLVAIVSPEDYEWASKVKWCAQPGTSTWYAIRNTGNRTNMVMHREIMKRAGVHLSKAVVIDHANHNGLDNRRENLRVCTSSENNINRRESRGASKYKGVYRSPNGKRWCAQIAHKRRSFHLGTFDTEEQAARAYDQRAEAIYGEFAVLNFPT